jgi:hypothetical protein
MVISQKPLNFGMKRHCKIQDNTAGNGLGNRCSIPELSPHRSTRYLRLVEVDFESNSLGNTSHNSHGIEAARPNRTAKALSANSTRGAELGGLPNAPFTRSVNADTVRTQHFLKMRLGI